MSNTNSIVRCCKGEAEVQEMPALTATPSPLAASNTQILNSLSKMPSLDFIDFDKDFEYYLITIDLTKSYTRYKPLEFEYGRDVDDPNWIFLFPAQNSFKELKYFPIDYFGEKLDSYIKYNGTDIWIISKINFRILKSFKSDFGNWDRNKLQPFFFYNYKKEFFDYESFYDEPYHESWYNLRPTYITIQPKDNVYFSDEQFTTIIAELNKELALKNWLDERFQYYYSVIPAFLSWQTISTRIFLYKENLTLKHSTKSKGIYLDESLLHFIKLANNIVQLNYYYYEFLNFRMPQFHTLGTSKLTLENLIYSEELSLNCLQSYQQFQVLNKRTAEILDHSEEEFEKYKSHLIEYTYETENRNVAMTNIIIRDFVRFFVKLKKFDRDSISNSLEKIMQYVNNFFTVTTTRYNIKLQKKVFQLSVLVFLLATVTILFATWDEKTILKKIITHIFSAIAKLKQ